MMLTKISKTIGCALSLLLASEFAAASTPNVLTTIKPLQLISQAITEGVTESQVLLPSGASPHDYSLRPSDARKIHSAEVIFWIGSDLESFLSKPLASNKDAKVVSIMESNSIKLLKNDEGDDHTSHDHHDHHDHDHHDHDHHGHDHGEYNPHLWMSTDNGRAIATVMAETLSEVDRKHAQQYNANLQHFLKTLDAADKRNEKELASLKDTPFFVFHDAYGYLKDKYGLNIGGHFTLTPEQQPGARHLTHLRDKLEAVGKTCIFREPQFQPAYIDRIIEGLDVKIGVLDPLAENIKVGPDGYAQFIDGLTDNIKSCMSR